MSLTFVGEKNHHFNLLVRPRTSISQRQLSSYWVTKVSGSLRTSSLYAQTQDDITQKAIRQRSFSTVGNRPERHFHLIGIINMPPLFNPLTLKVWWKIFSSFVGNIHLLFSSERILKID